MLTPLTDDDPIAIGPYRLQNRIGEGGMGTVYLAFTDRRHPVAVKVASAELSEDVEFRRRFQREVRAAQRVHGGAVAAVLDADTTAERPWMVTEYVEGTSLADAVRQRGPLAEQLVRGLAAGLADALVAIHEVGVVHRDLKPSNILLAWDGPKVIDFGIAQLDGNATLTRSGHVVGTLAWMAPEQMRGEQAGPAADIFSWGCCVAYAAAGRHPFHAERAEALAFRIQRDPPDLEHLPDYLFDTVVPALEKEPRLRPSAAALLAALSGQPVRSSSDAHRATETVLERDWTGQLPSVDARRGLAGHQDQGGWASSPLPVPVSPPVSFPSPASFPPPVRALPSAPPLPPGPVQPLDGSQGDWRPQPDHRYGPPSSYPEPPQLESGYSAGPYARTPYPDASSPGFAHPGPAYRAPALPEPARAEARHADPAYADPEHSYAQPSARKPPPPEATYADHVDHVDPRLASPPTRRAPDGDWRSARAGSLGVPPPAGAFRPAPLPPASSPPPVGAPPAEIGPAAVNRPPGASTGRPAGGGRARRRQPSPGWNIPAVLSALLAVLWLFGVGSAAGVYLGYRARAAARGGPRPGDRLAVVGIVLGWPGLVAALLYLGYVAGHG